MLSISSATWYKVNHREDIAHRAGFVLRDYRVLCVRETGGGSRAATHSPFNYTAVGVCVQLLVSKTTAAKFIYYCTARLALRL